VQQTAQKSPDSAVHAGGVIFFKGSMKHILAFSILVFAPLVGVYMYQRNNEKYEGFKWSRLNDAGLVISLALVVFILIANFIAPNFVYRFSEGWHSYKSNEYTYAIFWFVGLLLLTFPHVCKRSAWPSFPSALQTQSLYKTKWYSIVGVFMVLLSILNTIRLSQ